ncbi:TetR/AcrR family transcriptional regulator [Nocardia bovistercoris]|uniref:TetR/AcrR family transcriptional regulator n=1 Tax=Nocardia bovistercoris TaxID=2785916 RepID=A0A931N6Q0_9NOCA|nr:TetR/AcrR family transcriptional regulator [Nocardia bovistercoris]MBH0780771.1 TetR/AcrR family transcriptional regulator [Nocardia bovistercoris]
MERTDDVAARIAKKTLAKRGADYADEVRRLLDAALTVMTAGGIAARPRVADIVAAAELSNDAFYRHFPSKDALVAALLEDGAERLARYAAHQMDKESDPRERMRSWVAAILAQADERAAAATLAVLWNAAGPGLALEAGPGVVGSALATLLRDTLVELGSAAPDSDALSIAHVAVGTLADLLRQRSGPTDAEVDRITAFCLRALTPAAVVSGAEGA